jgi:hypothetical protein
MKSSVYGLNQHHVQELQVIPAVRPLKRFGNRASDLVNSTYSGREVVKMRIRPKATYEHPNEVLETWDNNEQEEQYLQEPVYILDPHDGFRVNREHNVPKDKA